VRRSEIVQKTAERPEVQRITLNVSEAALVSGVGKSSLYAEMEAKRLPYIKVGRRRLIRIDALKAWLDSCERGNK
jgi:excisionase family DNA binding protein